jgi:hypothetical protein
MKPVILAVLLLLAVASIVSGNTKESGIFPGNATESNTVSSEAPASGKSRNGDEKCLLVILQALQLYKIVSFLHYKLRQGVWRNYSKTPGVFFPAVDAKAQVA